jgi:nucleotide-binding universal stress UspA family protein
MRRVVIGFDGSPAARVALDWARDETVRRGVPLLVVTVVDERIPDPRLGEIRDEIESITQTLAHGVATSLRVERGHAAARLLDECARDDLLVVGSRGQGALMDTVQGSVCRAVLHAAPCPVAVVREGPLPRGGPVLVGLDGSPGSRAALEFGREESLLRGTTLEVAHAVHWVNVGEEWITPSVDDLLAWGHTLLDQEVRGIDVAVNAVVEHGRPAEVLTARSANASLLVVGSRGRSPLTSLLLGSTADDCSRQARCPVVVVRTS